MTDRKTPTERHEHARAQVLCVGKIRLDDRVIECDIVNISAEGAKIHASEAVGELSRLTLQVDPFGDFACDVIWQDGAFLGVLFLEESTKILQLDADLLKDPEKKAGSRETTRVLVLWSGRLYSGNKDVECRILNISMGGAKIHVTAASGFVSPVTLRIDRFGEFSCEIVWQDGEYMGLNFLDEPQKIGEIIGRSLPEIRKNSE
ncbi:MAG: PilZ domain-containing protein [Kiloniellaceae bacterium]